MVVLESVLLLLLRFQRWPFAVGCECVGGGSVVRKHHGAHVEEKGVVAAIAAVETTALVVHGGTWTVSVIKTRTTRSPRAIRAGIQHEHASIWVHLRQTESSRSADVIWLVSGFVN
ncbi:hypothetical protein ASPWEDRAFT_23747 [Aspergillus wentii DTO 134E9]|uniref:Secreted protein n=1 Tax=Aspergillus wentii DTO 134E9 TaxID=1073089 RepID=A0A1L9S3E4_ASPWE|nr:uncharacterized protein ASPWEDRAFT_23747 [Aspergillus wentii DTO 134E9]OJJ41679.1 hypothetical protein ASPWEDRAFT_23747 [Aspergillus wentii DTO 134E9]